MRQLALALALGLALAACGAHAANSSAGQGKTGAPAPLPACSPAAPPSGNNFSYFLLTAWWPATLFVGSEASYLVASLQAHGLAHTGFWMHGLWPARAKGASLLDCAATTWSVASLPPALARRLVYWWPGLSTPFTPTSAQTLWQHEWEKHGTCSGLQPVPFFETALNVSSVRIPQLGAALAAANITAGHSYSAGAITHALDAALGGPAFLLTCENQTDSGQLQLQEVQVCLSRATLQLCDCLGLDDGTRITRRSSCRIEDPTTVIELPNLSSEPTFGGLRTSSIVALVLGCIAGFVLLLLLVWLAAWQLGFITPLLKPRKVTVVHNPLVAEPVDVIAQPLDMEWLWREAPSLAAFVHDLPTGMAIKGGIARKILKRLVGNPERPGSFDIDCLVLLPEDAFEAHGHGHGGDAHTPQRAAHDAATGTKIGDLVLEAQDIEVIPKSHLRDYFLTRDVTINEVLVLKDSGGDDGAWIAFTARARADAAAGLVRPSVHVLSSDFQTYWNVDERTGRPFVETNLVCRCLVRLLKGHGTDIVFDEGTWQHWRRETLPKLALFKTLRAFHTNSADLQRAVEHLIQIGFLRRIDVWRAGGANLLWGLLLQEVNAAIARHGNRLQLGQLDPEGVEKWVTTKKAQTASKLLFQSIKARRTGWVPSPETTETLGRLTLPQRLDAYITAGPTFDYEGFAASRQQQARQELEGTAGTGTDAGRATAPAASSPAPGEQPLPSGGAAAEPSTCSRRAAWGSFVRAASIAGPRLERLNSVAASGALAEEPADAAQLAKQASKRSRRSVKQVLHEAEAAQLPPPSQQPGLQQQQGADAAAAAAGSKHAAAPTAGAAAAHWVRYSELADLEASESPASLGSDTLGTLFTSLDVSGPDAALPAGASSLVSEADRSRKQPRSARQLLGFTFSVMACSKWWFAGGFFLALLAAGAQMILPLWEGMAFSLMSTYTRAEFVALMGRIAGVMAAQVVLSAGASVVFEVASRRTMSKLFLRLFNHVLSQDASFFSSISKGELMARLSGDCLALRGLMATTLVNLAIGVVTAACIVAVLLSIWQPGTYQHFNYYLLWLAIGIVAPLVEAGVAGVFARPLNQRMRQSQGRMFGFLLDMLTHIESVTGLGLQASASAAYRRYADAVFRNTFNLHLLMVFQRTFSLAVVNTIVLLVLSAGGLEVIANQSTIGVLVATLRYIRVQQRGVKMAADAWVQLRATLGNIERLLELHNRGSLPSITDADDTSKRSRDQRGAGAAALPADEEQGGNDSLATKDVGAQPASKGLRSRKRPPRGAMGSAVLHDVPAALKLPSTCGVFERMTGGVALRGCSVMVPGRAGRGALLRGLDLQVLPGQALLITGSPSEPLGALLDTLALLNLPYAGSVLLQLAQEPGSAAKDAATLQPGLPGCWHAVQHLSDWLPAARAHMGLVSDETGGVFRASAEDNVACAAVAAAAALATSEHGHVPAVSHAAVVAACRQAGLHDELLELPDGYLTVIGEATGFVLSARSTQQLALARALLKRPALWLVQDLLQLAAAVGVSRLLSLLQGQLAEGRALVLLAAAEPNSSEEAHVLELRKALHHAAWLRMVGGQLVAGEAGE